MGLERPRLIEAGDLRFTDDFDCDTPVLNERLRVYAWTNHNSGGARVYVCIDTDQDAIAGFYSLSAGAAEHASVPGRISRGLARYPIPVVLIGRLAVDRRYGNRGLGRSLIRNAFEHVLESADIVGTRAVMVQAKTPETAEFYRMLGFHASDSDPMLFFHLLKDIKRSLAAAEKQ
jgi:GNAT superfamily N-acetyltransferase